MRCKRLLVLLICMVVLSGCGRLFKTNKTNQNKNILEKIKSSKEEIIAEKKKEPEKKNVPRNENIPKKKTICEDGSIQESLFNLNTEDLIRKYLVGKWISDREVLSDFTYSESFVVANMDIDKDLNVHLSFYNRETNQSKGDYKGIINFDRQYASPNEAPDLISIELIDADHPGGDFFFKHRTVYDGKCVMSLFFAGNGNCIFDMLVDIDNFEYAPEEIIFEKTCQEISPLTPLKNSEFYAVFWGDAANGKSLWLDEVQWTPIEEYDPDPMYPDRMMLYEDDVPGSVLYNILPDKLEQIVGTNKYEMIGMNKFEGEVYFVKTDENGTIIEFEDAAYKAYIDGLDGLGNVN